MKTFLLATVTALWLALLAGLPLTVHADGGDTTLIHACVLNKDGSMRIVSATTTCKGSETPLHWVNVARVSAIETKNTTQDSSISAVQTKNNTQDSSISAIQSKDTQQDAAIQALQGQTGGGLNVVDSNSRVLGALVTFPSIGPAVIVNGIAVAIPADISGFGINGVTFFYSSADCSGPRFKQATSSFLRAGEIIGGNTNLVFFAGEPAQLMAANSVGFYFNGDNLSEPPPPNQCTSTFISDVFVGPALSFALPTNTPPFHVE